VHITLFRTSKKPKYLHTTEPSYQQRHQQCHSLRIGLSSSEGALFFYIYIYMAAAAQTNTPRLAAGMALFQPPDWFSVAQLLLSLAIRIVCQKMDECNLSKSILTTFHIAIEERFFLSDSYRFIAQP